GSRPNAGDRAAQPARPQQRSATEPAEASSALPGRGRPACATTLPALDRLLLSRGQGRSLLVRIPGAAGRLSGGVLAVRDVGPVRRGWSGSAGQDARAGRRVLSPLRPVGEDGYRHDGELARGAVSIPRSRG